MLSLGDLWLLFAVSKILHSVGDYAVRKAEGKTILPVFLRICFKDLLRSDFTNGLVRLGSEHDREEKNEKRGVFCNISYVIPIFLYGFLLRTATGKCLK